MEKRGQISFIIIFAIVIILAFIFIFLLRPFSESEEAVVQVGKLPEEVKPVAAYVESCLESAGEKTLWRVGARGGYNELTGISSTTFQEDNVPYFLESGTVNYPTPDEIEEEISEGIIIDFQECFDITTFEKTGLEIVETKPALAKARIGKEDVIIEFNYPLLIKRAGFETILQKLAINLPIRIGALYNSAVDLVNNIKTNQPYNINRDCGSYNTNGKTNLFFKNNEIIQFVDYSTYDQNYVHSYVFQFALKDFIVGGGCFD